MDARTRRNSLITIMTCVTVMGIGWGLSTPIIALLMNEMGASRTLIGINTALPAVATLVLIPFSPAILRRFGIRPALAGFLAVVIASILAFKVFENLIAWFPIRFIFGMGLAGMFVATEVWINSIAEEHVRGRILGVYSTCLAGGFALGVLILGVMGSRGWAPFLVAAGLVAAALVLLLSIRTEAPRLDADGHDGPLWPFIKAVPAAMGGVAVFGAVEMGVFSLMPVYGVRAGHSEAMAAAMLAVLAAGNIALQLPIGALADWLDRRLVLVLCALGGVIGAALVPVLIDHPIPLFITLFLTGGVIVGLYTVGLVLIGERFTGASLAGANAAFILFYGIGSLIGPPLAGGAMDVWDPHGLMLVLGLMSAAYVLLAGYQYWRAPRPSGGPTLGAPPGTV